MATYQLDPKHFSDHVLELNPWLADEAQPKKRSKYGNIAKTVELGRPIVHRGKQLKPGDTVRFDSKLEAEDFHILCMLLDAGHISQLELQVTFNLSEDPNIKMSYVADFRFYDVQRQQWRVHDSKGHMTREAKRKLTIFARKYPEYKLTTGKF